MSVCVRVYFCCLRGKDVPLENLSSGELLLTKMFYL